MAALLNAVSRESNINYGSDIILEAFMRKLQNSKTTSKDESLCNAIDNALNLLKEADLVL